MPEKLLSDLQCRKAKARVKPYRLADGGNLYLLVAPTGVKSWQLRYRYGGLPQTLTIGKYDAVSLEVARAEAVRKRQLASAGEHLTAVKQATKLRRTVASGNTFAKVAADWIEREARAQQWSADYRREVEASVRNHLSALDPLPIADITAPVAAPVLRAVEHVAPLMWEKVRSRLRAIFDYGVEHGLIVGNPLPVLRRTKKRRDRKHFPAVVNLAGVGAILRDARSADPCKGVQRAHLLLAFTGQRVAEVVGAKWSEIDLSAGAWRVPRERMKQKDVERGPHEIPLPPRLLALLREWRTVDGESLPFVCPAPRDPARAIVPEAVEKFYRNALQLGGKHSPHSWRSAFSTICRDAGKDGDVIEAQLDHIVGSKVAAAYDRAKRFELRRALLRWYEAQLIAARDGANVTKLEMRKA